MEQDTPATARRRARELRTVSQMIALYCAGNHGQVGRTERAECGEGLCPACKQLDEYAALRTRRCPRMAGKAGCDLCPHPCYAPAMRERIREVMRYAGPRMLLKHPAAAIRHLAGRLRERQSARPETGRCAGDDSRGDRERPLPPYWERRSR